MYVHHHLLPPPKTLTFTDSETLPHKKFVSHVKPYWTKTVKSLHQRMREHRSIWIANGKIHDRENALFRAYKTSKREFRRECEIAYDFYLQDCAQKMEDSIDVDQRYVWSVLKSRRKKRVICRELKVNGGVYTDDNDICEAWAKHFESIFKTDRTLIHQDKEQRLKQQINMIRLQT